MEESALNTASSLLPWNGKGCSNGKRLSVGGDIEKMFSGTSHCALEGIKFEVVAQSDMTVHLLVTILTIMQVI